MRLSIKIFFDSHKLEKTDNQGKVNINLLLKNRHI
jgi:hypothetical protein